MAAARPQWSLGLRLRYPGAEVATPLPPRCCGPAPTPALCSNFPHARRNLGARPAACAASAGAGSPLSGGQTPRPGGEFGPQREGTEVGGCVGSEEGPGRGASESCRYQVRLERVELAMRRSEWERASGVAKAGRTGGLGMREDLRTGRRNSWENKRKACSWESTRRSGG